MIRNTIYKLATTLLLLTTWAIGSWGQTYYVFKYNGHYVAHNGYTTDGSEICVEDNFSIEKCLWEHTSGGGSNGNQEYLKTYGANYWLYYLSNTTDPDNYTYTLALKSTAPQGGDKQDGWHTANTTNGIRRYLKTSSGSGWPEHYVCYNDNETPCWELVTTAVNTKKALGTALTKTETSYKIVSSAIGGGSDVISVKGTYSYNVDATTVNSLSYVSFTDAGTTRYWYDDSEHDTAPVDWGNVEVASLTKTWSIVEGGEYASINAANGELTVTDLPTSGSATVTIRCVIADNASHSLTVEKSVALEPGIIEISSLAGITSATGKYRLTSDFSTTGTPANGIGTTKAKAFKGTLDGGLVPITGAWDKPLFNYVEDATIKNIIIENVTISEQTNSAGALVSNAEGATRIYNCGINGGSVGAGSAKNAGGLVGNLNGTSRVINCYSYATITGGNNVGGIVGNNGGKTTAASINTMVMNCMFYGDITGGSTVSPVYGGNNINNLQGGLNTYNYYSYENLKTTAISEGKYNCALAVEEKYLNRFEFYRLLLNSNKKLAAFYATGSTNNANQMAKWVLETADRTISGRDPYPYPILKAQGKYPSIINPDIDNAPDSASVGRNKGGKLGKTLAVTIATSKSDGGQTWPTEASITKTSLTLQRTDKDFDRFNFNYDKVQLPYYNDVGEGNYTGNRVVTGWKITAITAIDGDPYTTSNYPTSGVKDYPDHNYADRKSSNKDLYTISKRVFSQGAYFDVPYGVTSITIEPYWGQAAYISDTNYDVVYKNDYTGKQNVTQTGTQTTTFNNQSVYNSMTNALNALTLGSTVYDKAVVLVGNLHLDGVPSGDTKAFTMMSVDKDKDHEPDYSLIYHHKSRTAIAPIRFDFLAIPGTAQAQKPNTASLICNFTIFKTQGWFETTNTSLFYSSQLEYENLQSVTKANAPLILHGGVIDQFVSTQSSAVNGNTIYIHLGGNVWMHEFNMGTHSDGSKSTPHVPVSVTGGDYESFYLTGTYNSNAEVRDDNAECYISSGRFGEVAGAGQEQIGKDDNTTKGNVHWQIYNADITNFFGGGVNDAKPVKGNITTDIYNSYVDVFCGGPKFGNMATGKTVTTNAEGCTFRRYFGGGYGGNSYSRKKYYDNTTPAWATTLQGYYTTDKGKYFNGTSTNSKNGGGSDAQYGKKGPGVAVDFDYEFFVWSSGSTGGRFFVKFVSFSLAQCNDVNSTLKNCTITDNFYGGGSLGKVTGTATSVLENCKVTGSVYGGGYSATLPAIPVRTGGFTKVPKYNSASGMFEPGVYSGTTDYTWKQVGSFPSEGGAGFDGTQVITTQNLDISNLGSVGEVSLTIDNNTTVGESIYGGGEESAVNGNTSVTVNSGSVGVGNTGKFGYRWGNVYGGGKGKITIQNDGSSILDVENKEDLDAGIVKGNTNVTINGTPETTKILHNVYGGGAVGSVGTFTRNAQGMPTACVDTTGLATVTINGGKIGHDHQDTGMVDGSSRGWEGNPDGEGAFAFLNQLAWVNNTNVIIGNPSSDEEDKGPSVMGSVYGGGENGHNFQNGQVTVHKGTIGFEEGTWDCGNVYGAGCGTDTYWIDANGNDEQDAGEEHHNPMAGLVRGNTTVTINGGHILRNVYGAGSMGSVGTDADATSGKTTITVNGGKIGTDDTEYGNVFGGPKGNLDDTEVIAHVRETQVNINDGDINYCVYGGGEAGIVKDSTKVIMSGGTVNHSIYGGGCLADVLGNTRVEMTDGYVFNGIFGGGYSGSVGTITERSLKNYDGTDHASHPGCIGGKPSAFKANTGKCTVVVTGGQIGPIEVATKGMTRPTAEGGPVPEGWVWGGGCGIVADPATDPDADFRTYVKETDVTIGGDAFILESIIGGGEFGRVLGNTHVTIQDNCQIGVGKDQANGDTPIRYTDEQFVNPATTTITSSNALVACSHYDYNKENPLPYDPYYETYTSAQIGQASTSNPSDGKTWIGCVFGGGSGYMPYKKKDGTGYGWLRSAGLVEGNTLVEIKGGHILTNVYGGNEVTDVKGKCTVRMTGGTIGVPRTLDQIKANPFNGNLYGAGKGDPRTYFNEFTNVGSVEVDVSGGIIYGSVYGGGEDGHVTGNVTTTIRKETGEGKVAPVIGCDGSSGDDGNVFGAGQGSTVSLTSGVVSGNVELNIQDGDIKGSVYGGGQIGSVGTHVVAWKIEDPNNSGQMIVNPLYGKMKDGNDHGCLTVNLTGGTIHQNVYGGCMGTTADVAFGVSKNVAVNLNGYETDTTPWTVADDAQGCAVMGSIFGCNNVNSSPEGTVKVHIYKTQRAGQSRITNTEEVTTAKVAGEQDTHGEFDLSTFDVKAVYGGGNMAAYVPKDLENGKTNVIIDGCDRTSIGQVYGGGNAASTPATSVTIYGTYEIGELFGGGNGKDSILVNNVKQANPGANVGYKDYHLVEDDPAFATKEARVNGEAFAAYRYGTGRAEVNVYGGKVHRVFGGSNTKGNVRKTAVTLLDEAGGCAFNIDEAYGGGKSASMDAEAQLLMACIPGLKAVYGGAQEADIHDDVTLNITNGTFDRVFGGNNISGIIRGKITVNIEEVGCRPIIIGELYGGGNQAGYSIYGYKQVNEGTVQEPKMVWRPRESATDDGEGPTTPFADPEVNIKSFTSIGNVYGGGYGATAVMVGNPTVSINEVYGRYYNDDASIVGNNAETPNHYPIPSHAKGKMGAINNVFGGGNAAKVIGNTNVNIGTLGTVDYVTKGSGETEPQTGITVVGADIRGNVYGGGNNAEVTGSTNVTVGKREP